MILPGFTPHSSSRSSSISSSSSASTYSTASSQSGVSPAPARPARPPARPARLAQGGLGGVRQLVALASRAPAGGRAATSILAVVALGQQVEVRLAGLVAGQLLVDTTQLTGPPSSMVVNWWPCPAGRAGTGGTRRAPRGRRDGAAASGSGRAWRSPAAGRRSRRSARSASRGPRAETDCPERAGRRPCSGGRARGRRGSTATTS